MRSRIPRVNSIPIANSDKLTKADSSNLRINNKIDSVQSKVNGILNPDLSLQSFVSKVKLNSRKARKDSLQFYKQVEKEKKKVKIKMDSAESAGLPIEKYQQQLDSLDKVKYDKNDDSWEEPSSKQKLAKVK